MRCCFLSRFAPVILALLSLMLLSRPASAATLGVPSQYPTIQAAVNAAQSGDTVLIADGTYTGPSNVDIDFGGKNLTVTSQHGAASTIIDCQGTANANHRGFYLHSGETAAVISGLTIQNGYENGSSGSSNGGAVYEAGSGLTVQSCVFNNNAAPYGFGGGLYASTGYGSTSPSGSATSVINCVFAGNAAGYGGGALFGGNSNGSLFLVLNCTLTGNGTGPNSSSVIENASYPSAAGAIALVNDILYGNTGAEIFNEGNGSANATAAYSDIQGGYAGTSSILNADPQFVGGPANMHLKAGSPCLGAGTAAGAPTQTLDGRTRPSPPSMGAYEVISSGTAATTTNLTSTINPSVAGQSVTFVVNVAKSAASTATPSGSVTFAIDGHPAQPVTLSNGYYASYQTSSLTIGSHLITAAYSGDATYTYSASTLTQVVTPSPQYVSPSGSDINPGTQAAPKLTIQAAINATNNGGGVVVEDGTYTGPGDVDLDFGGRNITVKSQNGPATTIIDCGGSSIENHRGFYLHSGETNVAISGLTIENGYGSYGGGIDDENTAANTIAVSNCVLQGNTAFYGGGINISSPTNSTATITGCIFVDNTANLGGGFYNSNGSNSVVTLTGCTFTGNAVNNMNGINSVAGGGIYSQGGGQVTLTRCKFSTNSAQLSNGAPGAEGGGAYIYAGAGKVTVTGCSFTSNTALGGEGGGFADTADGGAFVISNCEMIGNQAAKGGGINTYISSGGTVAITNCTLTANSASTGLGSGVYNESYVNNGFTTLTNDILYGDGGTEYTFVADNYGFTGVTATASYCDIQGGYAGTGNINADPLFVLPPFMGALPDLHLKYNSPCIGAGTASGAPTTTIDGVTRFNPPSIGAYEAAVTGTTTTLASSQNPSTVGQSVSFTAAITGTSGTPTGTVTFTLDGAVQTPITLSTGQATLTTSALAVGSHTLTTAYSGDRLNASSTSTTLTQTVDTLTTSTTTLASSLNPSTYGQQVSFTATITGSNPTGTVTFADATTGNSLNTITLSAGSATIVTSGLGAGTHQIIAIYSGDAGNTGSISPSVAQVVHVVPTTITVASSLNPSTAGQSVTFTASVTGTSGTPTGTVTFTLDGAAQAPVTLASGQAAFITSALTAGSHTLTAAYSGDQFNAASTSAILTQKVSAPPVNQVRFAPRPGYGYRMVGGLFQGSHDGTTYTTLATVTKAPPDNQYTALPTSADPATFRYLRYLAPNGTYGNVAEIEFDSSGAKLTGTGFGTPGSYYGNGYDFTKALDGSTSTYFDSPYPGNGDFVGIDRGAPVTSNTGQVRFAPRPGYGYRMVGGVFQGSHDGTTYTTLATVTKAPPDNQYTALPTSADPATFRYLRYLAPNGTYGNVAEIEFDSSGVKVTGIGFGTPGSYYGNGNTFTKALDGNTNSYFDAPYPGNGDFAGIDQGAGK